MTRPLSTGNDPIPHEKTYRDHASAARAAGNYELLVSFRSPGLSLDPPLILVSWARRDARMPL